MENLNEKNQPNKPSANRNYSVDYELLDYGDCEKLERFGNNVIIRPETTFAINEKLNPKIWQSATCAIAPHKTHFIVEKTEDFKEPWTSSFDFSLNGEDKKITFALNTESSQQVGLFPEHAEQWSWIAHRVASYKKNNGSCSILNLFGYTGAASLAAASAGADVCHIDSSTSALALGKQSQQLSEIEDSKIRWLKDDVITFLNREVKRGSRYDGIIMDPPAFGRGPDGETFSLEEDIHTLIGLCAQLISKKPAFIVFNQYPKNISEELCAEILRAEFPTMQLSRKKLILVCKQDGRQVHYATGIMLVPAPQKSK
jgi:23S rRNA (cytosine1962-C5)-methyltransferase